MELSEAINPNNTINITKLNKIKRDTLRPLENFKNIKLSTLDAIKTVPYEKIQPQFVKGDDTVNRININEDKAKDIYKNYREMIIKGNYTNATEAIKIIDEILNAYDEMGEMRNSVYKTLNNRKIGTLSELALNTLPKTEEEFKNKLTESFGEDANIDEYMSVYSFEKNKDKLQEAYNPKNESSGGKKTKKRKRIKKNNKSKSRKIKTKRHMKTISNLKRRTKHYKSKFYN